MAQLALVLFFRRDSKLNVTEGEASAVFYFSLETVPFVFLWVTSSEFVCVSPEFSRLRTV